MEAGVTWVSFGMMRVLEKQRLAEGEALKRQRVVAWRAEAGDRHPGTIGALANLAANLQEQRKLSEAEPLLREVVARQRLTLPLARVFIRGFPRTELARALEGLDHFAATPPAPSGPCRSLGSW